MFLCSQFFTCNAKICCRIIHRFSLSQHFYSGISTRFPHSSLTVYHCLKLLVIDWQNEDHMSILIINVNSFHNVIYTFFFFFFNFVLIMFLNQVIYKINNKVNNKVNNKKNSSYLTIILFKYAYM